TARSGRENLINRAIRKYGADAFQRVVLFYAASKPELDAAERTYILAFRSNEPERGYNLTLGGEGNVGWQPTEETRRRIGASRRGWQPTEETRRRMSMGQRTSALAAEHLRQISEANRGKKRGPLTEEHRRKVGDAQRGRKHTE